MAAQSRTRKARRLFESGQIVEALDLASAILTRHPDDFDAAYLRASALTQLGNLPAAQDAFGKALELDKNHIEARYNFALLLNVTGKHELAVPHYEVILATEPEHFAALTNLAGSLHALGRFDDALAVHDRIVALDGESAQALLNRGTTLLELERFEEAVPSLDRAIARNGKIGRAFYNRGIALHGLRRFDDALRDFDRAVELEPGAAEIHHNRGAALRELMRFDEALASFGKAISKQPGHVDAHLNQGYVHLLRGNFAEGWAKYEWRWQTDTARPARSFDKPIWLGAEDISGKTVLVHWEQGFGDGVQFARYIPLLEQAGARVLFAPHEPLKKLMASLPCSAEIVDVDDPSLAFDYRCPLLSLPLVFGTNADSIPHDVPYLHADPALAKAWGEKAGGHGFRIGICWQGRRNRADSGRSFPLAMFEELSNIDGVRLISVHKGDGESQLAHLPAGMSVETLENFAAGPDSFLDTAAVIANLDLVITSDTVIAHLAGALGRPVWVALKRVPDWRWLLDRDDSPWYPTMRLFRQATDGDWQGVFVGIRQALVSEMAGRFA